MQLDRLQSEILHRLQTRALAIPPSPASVWVHGSSPKRFEEAEDVFTGLVAGEPRIRLFLTSANRNTVDFLRKRFPDEKAAPLPHAPFLGRFVGKVRPGLLLLLDGRCGNEISHAASRLGVPVVSLDARKALYGASAERAEPTLLSPPNPSAAELPRALRPFLPEPPDQPLEQAWINGSFRDRIGQSKLWSWAGYWWTTRRIDDWWALRKRLGHPRTILCLGNGPSSEDPRLLHVRHDCLFRVNWRWRDRGFLTEPHLVFVGDAATVHKISPPLFGLWNRSIESAALLRRLATRGPRRMSYITLERLSPLIGERKWPARPTNGALMIVTAAGLEPERLVIGGMDLFQHEAGRYPDDKQSRNDYSRCHSRDVDLELIDAALRDYGGELIILSENLRRALARRREANGVDAA